MKSGLFPLNFLPSSNPALTFLKKIKQRRSLTSKIKCRSHILVISLTLMVTTRIFCSDTIISLNAIFISYAAKSSISVYVLDALLTSELPFELQLWNFVPSGNLCYLICKLRLDSLLITLRQEGTLVFQVPQGASVPEEWSALTPLREYISLDRREICFLIAAIIFFKCTRGCWYYVIPAKFQPSTIWNSLVFTSLYSFIAFRTI